MSKNTQTRVTETLLSDLQGQRYDCPAKVLALRNNLAQANLQRDRFKLDVQESKKKLEQAKFQNWVLIALIFILMAIIVIGGMYVSH